ncbi:hypothetical protein ABZW18_18980 [Streptomyces sp. NPDC004647]|uniref:hypothetical protein n=1 Tax=Streptomyces sp. NPDC004647 TaxID=3154671 RepID=UPI0033AC3B9E
MDRHELDELCEQMLDRFSLPRAATYKDACRRVCEVMSELLSASVEVKFIRMRSGGLSGATVRLHDGSYAVLCASSRSWYHRLGILLHEFAHVLLGHEGVGQAHLESLRRFAPHLPSRMSEIIASRTTHAEKQELEAEEFADRLLYSLTERQYFEDAEIRPSEVTPQVMRVAEAWGTGAAGSKRSKRPAD